MKTKRPEPMKAITCPRCGSTSVEFITEYHKCIWLKFFRNLCLITAIALFVLFLVLSLDNMKFDFATIVRAVGDATTDIRKVYDRDGSVDIFLYISAALVVVSFAMQTVVYFAERRTHVQGICRDCGNIWRLN